jgi:mediator of replication checkpoint protein 1
MKSRQANKEDSDSDPDGENGRRLTQSSRPTRKAGKKALEDIAREQQRISRNMQLTHQAKTKKKYGMKDLLSKFGLGQVDSEIVAVPTPDASSVLASSDVEGNHIHDTPPTSPPSQDDDVEKETHISDAQTQPAKGTPVPELALFSPSAPSVISKTDKGKGRAPEFEHVPQNPLIKQSQPITANSVLESKTLSTSTMIELSDSDEDFNVIKAESRFPVFDRLPQQKRGEAPSLLHLRHLAHLTSPGKKGPKGKQSMNITELQLSLIHKARRQAQKERDEKIEDLRRRGIHIETEEERAKLQMEIEDMAAQFEKARQEDLKLGKLERDEAKKNGEALDDLPSSDESDADYAGSDAEEADAAELEQDEEEDADIELSGSEDEEMAEDDDVEEVDDEEMSDRANGLLDDAAEEDDEEDQDELENGDDLEDETVTAPSRKRTMNRARNVVVDDEDESADEAPKMSMPTQQSTQLSHTQEDSGMAAFGFNNAGPTLGLTQMFAGTMADLNSESQNAHSLDNEPEQDSLDFLRSLPDTQPGHLFDEDPDMLVPNSQAGTSHQNDSQPTPARQMTLGITQLLETSPAFSHTQASETFEPTQDAGFELSRSPAGLIPPPSTIDTVMMPIAESPITKRKGRLHQRKEAFGTQISDVEDVEDIDTTAAADEQLESQTENAFAALAKAAKKLKKKEDNFNKKTSWARDAIEEQAEESEDEYAGIGGGSDEDSGEEDEELAQMIDTNDIKVDERKLAAFYA